MANLEETAQWEEGVYQFSENDVVQGGENGIDNVPIRQLANRTLYLKEQVEAVGQGLSEHESADDPHTQYTTEDEVAAKVNAVLTGSVSAFAMTTPPDGWLECNGVTLSRSLYPELFAVIGEIFGAGDGSTTFKIPDLRGEFIRGYDNGRGIDLGRVFGVVQAGMVGPHTHMLPIISRAIGTGSSASHPVNIGSEDSQINIYNNSGTETRPRNVALMFCIKY